MMLEILSRERIRRKEAREKWSGNLFFPQLLMSGIKEEITREFVGRGADQFHSMIPTGTFKQEMDEGFVNSPNCTATLKIKKEPFDANETTSVENHLLSFPTPGRTDDEDTEDERIAMDELMNNISEDPMINLVAVNNDINGLEKSNSDSIMISEIVEIIPDIHLKNTGDSSKLDVEINNNAEGISGTCHNFGKEVECSTSESIVGGIHEEKSKEEESSSEIAVDKVNETLMQFVTPPSSNSSLKKHWLLDDLSAVPMKKVRVEEFGRNVLEESSSDTPLVREIEEISPDGHSQNIGDSSKCEVKFNNNAAGSLVEEVQHSIKENTISEEESKSEIVVDKVNEPSRHSMTTTCITSAPKKEGKNKWNLPPPVPASRRHHTGTEKSGEALRPPYFGPPLRWMIPVPIHLRGQVTGSGGFHTNMIQRLTGTWITWDSQHCIVEGSRAGVARASSMIQGRICRIN